ncbi:hypothetical protein AKJ16_DCAP23133, partial [Drosera capensis]
MRLRSNRRIGEPPPAAGDAATSVDLLSSESVDKALTSTVLALQELELQRGEPLTDAAALESKSDSNEIIESDD